jgi:hypothetical protein
MRGEDQRSEVLFSYVRLESRIPADHPLRAIRTLIDEALNGLSRDFNKLYARDGRPSIPPEDVVLQFAKDRQISAFWHGVLISRDRLANCCCQTRPRFDVGRAPFARQQSAPAA